MAKKMRKSADMFADTFEYGFYEGDEFRAGEVHIDNEDGNGVWLVEIYGINGDSFEGYGSGDDVEMAARDAIADSGLKLDDGEISDFLEHIEFTMQEQGFTARRKATKKGRACVRVPRHYMSKSAERDFIAGYMAAMRNSR